MVSKCCNSSLTVRTSAFQQTSSTHASDRLDDPDGKSEPIEPHRLQARTGQSILFDELSGLERRSRLWCQLKALSWHTLIIRPLLEMSIYMWNCTHTAL
jgi:hypothetical protein